MKRKRYINWKPCGERIQAERKRIGLTREQLDISTKNWSRVESGKQATSLDTIYKASLLLNISIDYLLSGSEKRMDSETSFQVLREKTKIARLLDNCSCEQLTYISQIIRSSLQMYNLSQLSIGQDESK